MIGVGKALGGMLPATKPGGRAEASGNMKVLPGIFMKTKGNGRLSATQMGSFPARLAMGRTQEDINK